MSLRARAASADAGGQHGAAGATTRVAPTLLCLWLCLAACAPALTPPPVIPLRIAATDLAYPLLADLEAAYRSAAPLVEIHMDLRPRSALGEMLASGEIDLALAASPEPGLFATPLAYAEWRLIVHPQNPLGEVSAAQARALFEGQAADWSQVGGPAGAVLLVAREPGSEADNLFLQAFGVESIPPAAQLAPSWEAMRQSVARAPQALGYLPAAELNASVRALPAGTAPRILLIALALSEPSGAARDFLAWAQSPDGQAAAARQHLPLP